MVSEKLYRNTLLSARCIYLLLFKKNLSQVCVRVRPLPFPPNPIRMKMLIFQPPNILTPLENGRRSLKKQRDSKDGCACIIKRPFLSPIYFFFFCLLLMRQLKFAKVRDFAINTGSNFSYSVKSSSATCASVFNTEENRSFLKTLGFWLLHIKCLQYVICEVGCPVITPS